MKGFSPLCSRASAMTDKWRGWLYTHSSASDDGWKRVCKLSSSATSAAILPEEIRMVLFKRSAVEERERRYLSALGEPVPHERERLLSSNGWHSFELSVRTAKAREADLRRLVRLGAFMAERGRVGVLKLPGGASVVMHEIATVELPLEAGGPEVVVRCGLALGTASASAAAAELSPPPPDTATAAAEIEAVVAAAHATLEPQPATSSATLPATSSAATSGTALKNSGAASSAALSEAAAAVAAAAGRVLWYYKDERQAVQGPFEASQLNEWFGARTLPPSLPLRSSRHPPGIYTPLLALVRRHGGKPRFDEPLYEPPREPLSAATRAALEGARVSRAHLAAGRRPAAAWSETDDARLARDVGAPGAVGERGARWPGRQRAGRRAPLDPRRLPRASLHRHGARRVCAPCGGARPHAARRGAPLLRVGARAGLDQAPPPRRPTPLGARLPSRRRVLPPPTLPLRAPRAYPQA